MHIVTPHYYLRLVNKSLDVCRSIGFHAIIKRSCDIADHESYFKKRSSCWFEKRFPLKYGLNNFSPNNIWIWETMAWIISQISKSCCPCRIAAVARDAVCTRYHLAKQWLILHSGFTVIACSVSQHMHKITKLWKSELNWSSKLRDNW